MDGHLRRDREAPARRPQGRRRHHRQRARLHSILQKRQDARTRLRLHRRHHRRRLRRGRELASAREVVATEKPRTLTFDLSQDPKYDTGLVCGGTLDIFASPSFRRRRSTSSAQATSATNSRKPRPARASTSSSPTIAKPTPTASAFLKPAKSSPRTSTRPLAALTINESVYIVIVTRGHRDDMRVLRWAVQMQARYIGMGRLQSKSNHRLSRTDQ